MMPPRSRSADLRGASRLAVAATLGVTDLVEAMHRTVLRLPMPLGRPVEGRTRGITGLVYGSVRGVTRLVGGSIDTALALLGQALPEDEAAAGWPGREPVLAALNGVLGDYLERTGNPLATPMSLRRAGQAFDPGAGAVVPAASGWIIVAIHGLCMTDLQWRRGPVDPVAGLADRLGATALHLRYNTGLHVSSNGRALSERLQALVEDWPVPVTRITLIGHSMGGLVARSAQHDAQLRGLGWGGRLRDLVFLGTPHHGAPLERGGRWLHAALGASPYSAAFARLGRLRSAGITDLRHGNLLDEDWQDSDRFAHARDLRVPVPLPDGVACYAIAATTAERADPPGGRLPGDGLVPLDSALGRHRQARRRLDFPPGQTWVVARTGHLALLGRAAVYRRIAGWLSGDG